MATNPDAGHPGDDYYVSPTGTIQQQSNPVAVLALKAAGYVGPYDWSDAKAKADEALLAKAGQAGGAEIGDLTTGGVANQGTRSGSAEAGSSVGAKAESGLDSIDSAVEHAVSTFEGFIQGFTSANLWVRIAKVVLGGALILVGVAKLTDAGGVLKKAVDVAPLL